MKNDMKKTVNYKLLDLVIVANTAPGRGRGINRGSGREIEVAGA